MSTPLVCSLHPTYCTKEIQPKQTAGWALWLCLSCAVALLVGAMLKPMPGQMHVSQTNAPAVQVLPVVISIQSAPKEVGSPNAEAPQWDAAINGQFSGAPGLLFRGMGPWTATVSALLMGLLVGFMVIHRSLFKDVPCTLRAPLPHTTVMAAASGVSHSLGTTLTDIVSAELAGTGNEDAKTVVDAIDQSCQHIAKLLARANIAGVLGSQGTINVQGEEQKRMDVISNDLLKGALDGTGLVSVLASEEEDAPVSLPAAKGRYAVAFDPLDGSSNLDCSLPTGTIFSIYDTGATPDTFSFLGPLDRLLIAGYALYSSSTTMVITLGKGTHLFTLDPEKGQFVLTKANVAVPPRGPFYSLNDGRSFDWPAGLQRYISDIKQGKGQWGKKYGARYVCSLVADIHRTLLYGGWAGNPRPHLRLLFESAPLSFVLEQATGAGSNGAGRLLDATLIALHQRSPFFAGSAEDVAELEGYGDVQQGAQKLLPVPTQSQVSHSSFHSDAFVTPDNLAHSHEQSTLRGVPLTASTTQALRTLMTHYPALVCHTLLPWAPLRHRSHPDGQQSIDALFCLELLRFSCPVVRQVPGGIQCSMSLVGGLVVLMENGTGGSLNFDVIAKGPDLLLWTSLRDYRALILGCQPCRVRRWLFEWTQQWIHTLVMAQYHGWVRHRMDQVLAEA